MGGMVPQVPRDHQEHQETQGLQGYQEHQETQGHQVGGQIKVLFHSKIKKKRNKKLCGQSIDCKQWTQISSED